MSVDERVTVARQIAVTRARAGALRALAAELEHSPAVELGHLAGPDTWCCQRADACRQLLAAGRARLLRAADELRWRAARLEDRATELAHEQARLDAMGAS